jgi:hypothetical protein
MNLAIPATAQTPVRFRPVGEQLFPKEVARATVPFHRDAPVLAASQFGQVSYATADAAIQDAKLISVANETAIGVMRNRDGSPTFVNRELREPGHGTRDAFTTRLMGNDGEVWDAFHLDAHHETGFASSVGDALVAVVEGARVITPRA